MRFALEAALCLLKMRMVCGRSELQNERFVTKTEAMCQQGLERGRNKNGWQ
jgi:hypothetical protein